MKNYRAEFFKTMRVLKASAEPIELVYERGKVIGAPVKVMRTGEVKPDEGWYIAEVYFDQNQVEIGQPLIKVYKPDKNKPKKGMQKLVSLEILERLNPELKFLIFEVNKNYVLYEDKDQSFKIGLVTDINLEEKSLLVMSGPKGEDVTAPLDRIKTENVIDKNNDPRKLEKFFQDEVKIRKTALSDAELKPSKKTRINKRKNLIYYLKIIDTVTNQPMGHSVDITKQGFMMIIDKPIEPGFLFQLKMFLPEEILGRRYFEFSAMSRWCRKDQNAELKYYNAGFQFADISSEGIHIINHLIEKYCF